MLNVVLIMLDSLRRDHIGCYGNDWIKTENIDALARLLMDNPQHHVATLVTGFDDPDQIANPNIVNSTLTTPLVS